MKNELSALFRVLADTLDNMTEEEYKNLLRGKGKLTYYGEKTINTTNNEENFERELMLLAEKLRGAKSREEAARIMDQEVRLKAGLIKLAKLIPVYTAASDTKQKLRERIIEAVVGPDSTTIPWG